MRAYGPVPSRRLGHSLGINNIPPKVCTYSCIYCQLGRTLKTRVERGKFYDAKDIVKDVESKVFDTKEKGESIDYLSFVPDGEPTLDINLGKEIDLLKSLDIDIAVITNASLLWREDVREDLSDADWVSLKVDASDEETWRSVNRPHESLEFEKVLRGMKDFADFFEGTLSTETMLIQDVNDAEKEIEDIVDFLVELDPDESYVAIPTRPPAEEGVLPADERSINLAYQTFSEKLSKVEYLIGYEGNEFSSTEDPREDLLNITSVHPMRREGVEKLLSKTGSDWSIIEGLIEEDKIVELDYGDKKFYMRKLPGR